MDNQDLNVFIAAADLGSFSEAAERVHLTQPAVSKRIANLEQEMGTPLFDRISRKVILTPAGQTLLPKARNILNDMENARQALSILSGEVNGQLSLAISHYLGLNRMPSILKSFVERYPNVELDIAFTDSEQAYVGVQQGRYEIAINTLAPASTSKVKERVLWTDKMKFVCRKDHELARYQNPTLADLADYRCLMPDLTTFTGRIVADLFNVNALRLQPAMSTNFMQTLAKMTEIGLGWSVLPELLIDTEKLIILDINVPLSRNLGVIYHAQRSLSQAAQAMLDTCQSQT